MLLLRIYFTSIFTTEKNQNKHFKFTAPMCPKCELSSILCSLFGASSFDWIVTGGSTCRAVKSSRFSLRLWRFYRLGFSSTWTFGCHWLSFKIIVISTCFFAWRMQSQPFGGVAVDLSRSGREVIFTFRTDLGDDLLSPPSIPSAHAGQITRDQLLTQRAVQQRGFFHSCDFQLATCYYRERSILIQILPKITVRWRLWIIKIAKIEIENQSWTDYLFEQLLVWQEKLHHSHPLRYH